MFDHRIRTPVMLGGLVLAAVGMTGCGGDAQDQKAGDDRDASDRQAMET